MVDKSSTSTVFKEAEALSARPPTTTILVPPSTNAAAQPNRSCRISEPADHSLLLGWPMSVASYTNGRRNGKQYNVKRWIKITFIASEHLSTVRNSDEGSKQASN
jgi:hypothetical protein